MPFSAHCRELGRQRSTIELNTLSMTVDQVTALEQSVNEKIRARVPVIVREFAVGDPEVEMVSLGCSNGKKLLCILL